MKLVWHDEFNYTGKPDSASWIYEKGFVRNRELQWSRSSFPVKYEVDYVRVHQE